MHHLICIGRLKDSTHLSLERDYLKRLIPPLLTIHELKSFGSQEKEAEAILDKAQALKRKKSASFVLLTEQGRMFQDSQEFSAWLHQSSQQEWIFIIGGAMGFSQSLKEKADHLISLSPLTFPHKLARLLFIEQYYRAQTIQQGHPYHH